MKKKTNSNKIPAISYFNYFLFFVGMVLAVLLAIPLFIGAFKIIYENGEIPSAESSIGLALVSVGLGAVVLWFTERKKSNKDEEQQPKEIARRSALVTGTFFVFAAICFTLFGLLSPIFPDAVNATDFFSIIVKWTGVLVLIAGSISLGFSLCISLFDVWFWHIGK